MSYITYDANKNPVVQFEGVILYKYERNLYDDSDFFFGYWDEASNSVKEVLYDTTRAAVPPYRLSVDATDDVRAKYKQSIRDNKAKALRKYRSEQKAIAVKAGISTIALRRLNRIYSENEVNAILALLAVKKFRSTFRESLAKQVREWAVSFSYSTPLSPRQLRALMF